MAASNSARQGSNPCAGANQKVGQVRLLTCRPPPPGGQIFAIINRDALSRVIMAAGGSAVAIEEESMKRHWPIVVLSVLALAAIDAPLAGAKQRHHGARHAV